MPRQSKTEKQMIDQAKGTLIGICLLVIVLYLSPYNSNSIFLSLLPSIVVIVAMIIFLYYFFKSSRFITLPFGFALLSAIILTIDYTEGANLTTLIAATSASIITVSGIIFALKNLRPDTERIISRALLAAILISFISVGASFSSFHFLNVASIFGIDAGFYLLCLCMSVIINQPRRRTRRRPGQPTPTRRKRRR